MLTALAACLCVCPSGMCVRVCICVWENFFTALIVPLGSFASQKFFSLPASSLPPSPSLSIPLQQSAS